MGGELAERKASSASAGPRVVQMRREAIPAELLLVKEDPSKLPAGVLQTREQLKQAQRDINWAGKREQVFAAVAAGWHLASFALNLAFWGVEGMPPDRYWPTSPRIRLQIRPGRYGNMDGGQRVYMDYLARSEGVPLN
ncbi:hypothetical protein CHLRE_16g685350v5 [Chlamydomonas reinhardtii]|uniref:Uncharacterized protein n=1 Tax=Chlamydomonas reinhardtii TaxID=3055 RepID=A8ISA4_CHLRE|nr:uncharacterized protein CHLRE_16g685350v5 [Chlamydomonas reinhardtii]PNW72030.1 hypothetical protein CHLRE_16g685350v5 [Chlamydomonas reinhardtii]|eukprot:XP_001691933.1 predicted protein [Chlamydomonas reinhardtii]